MMTTNELAGAAHLALECFRTEVGVGDNVPNNLLMMSMLIDLMHYADAEGIVFERVLLLAREQHANEVAEHGKATEIDHG